jgi:HlyD family secretion protein
MAVPRKAFLPAALLALAGGLGAWYFLGNPRHGNGVPRLSGNIETTEVAVSFKIPGRVEKRLVDEGQWAKPGELLAELDTADLDADVDLRAAELAAATAASAELEAGSRQEDKDAAKAAVEKAKATVEERQRQNDTLSEEIRAAEAQRAAAVAEETRLKSELGRATSLYQARTITVEQYDQAHASYQIALEKLRQAAAQLDVAKHLPRAEQLAQAQAALHEAEARERLVDNGPRQEVKDQAKAKVKQAEAALKLAKIKLGYAKVFSPLTRKGVVLSKNIEPGEYVSPGTPVVTVADLTKVWLRAYINETELDRIRLGQIVDVTTDGSKEVFKGRVAFISQEAEFTPKTVQTEKERVKLVYRIKIDIDNPDGKLKPGMPAEATVRD